jgi:multimeric flavodoxin WrbA
MNCYGVLKLMKESLADTDVEMEIINLGSYRLKTCIGNLKCLLREPYECIQVDDDLQVLQQKFEDADGYIFSIPVYIHSVPAILKNFMDRCTNWIHVYPLIGKYAAVVSTLLAPAVNAEEFTMALMREWLEGLGVCISGELSISTPGGYKETEALGVNIAIEDVPGVKEKSRELAATLVRDVAEKTKFEVDAYDLFRFGRMKLIARNVGGHEKEVFERNGWFDKDHWSL